jgi:ACS family tartrate transporter-like MFS transporter
MGILYLAIPVAVVVGSIISSPLLLLQGVGGFNGWQWLFIIEAIPALLLAIYIYFRLVDTPSEAKWLSAEEKQWLAEEIRKGAPVAPAAKHSLLSVLGNPGVLKFSGIYFCMNFAGVGLVLFLPLIVQALGVSTLQAGFVTAIPYAVVVCVLPFIGKLSDKNYKTRALHSAISALVVFGGLTLATTTNNPALMLAFISCAAVGIYAFACPFWALCSNLFVGSASAVAIAAINSVGNLSGFAAPYAMGWLKDTTGNFSAALICIAMGPLIAAISLVFVYRSTQARIQVEAEQTGRDANQPANSLMRDRT